MSMEEKLRTAARAATGDDSILDVAEFHPRGFAAAAGAGAGVGSAVGGGVSDSGVGSAIGAAGGTAAGMAAAASARDLPMRICVAVSPETVYLAEIEGMTGVDDVSVFAQMARSDIAVEVHGRAMNRVVILEDLKSEQKYEMEAPRIGPFHAKALVELLMLSEPHLETEASKDASE
jgi:hypothetical protein